MMIKDLEMKKELASEALSEVRGGANSIVQGGQDASVAVQGGGFFSSTAVNSTPVNAPVALISDNDLDLSIETKVANVAQSLGTLIWQ
jgi:Iap family predicted aminopeptidase